METVILVLFDEFYHVSYVLSVQILKCIKNISMSPHSLLTLQKVSAIQRLVSILERTIGPFKNVELLLILGNWKSSVCDYF